MLIGMGRGNWYRRRVLEVALLDWDEWMSILIDGSGADIQHQLGQGILMNTSYEKRNMLSQLAI